MAAVTTDWSKQCCYTDYTAPW